MALRCPGAPLHPARPGSLADAALAADRSLPRSAAARQTDCPRCCPSRSCPCATARPGAERAPPLPQRPAQPRGLAVRALLPTAEQPPQPRLERDQPAPQLFAPELFGGEAVPQRKEPLDFCEAPPANGLRLATPVHQGLEVAFEV